MAETTKNRCGWAGNDPLYVQYHDEEWGVPIHDDRKWFEKILLDSAQAGLSWITILRKREHYRQAYAHFDYQKVARFDTKQVEELLANPGIVRNRRKIEASLKSAQAFLRIQDEFGSFDAYIWRFIGGAPKVNHWSSLSEIPAKTLESLALSKDLIKRGFAFVGPTICYAFMQAGGMVNDHVITCFRHKELAHMADIICQTP